MLLALCTSRVRAVAHTSEILDGVHPLQHNVADVRDARVIYDLGFGVGVITLILMRFRLRFGNRRTSAATCGRNVRKII
jgi:hypothetical protein